MTDFDNTEKLYPFTVRVESGSEFAVYARDAAAAAIAGEQRSRESIEYWRYSPAVLVLRADEPFFRKRSRLRRLLDWIES